MSNPLVRFFVLRRLRRIRAAVLDWSVGEFTKTALDRLGALKEIGIAIPLLIASPESGEAPQRATAAPNDTPPLVQPLTAQRPSVLRQLDLRIPS